MAKYTNPLKACTVQTPHEVALHKRILYLKNARYLRNLRQIHSGLQNSCHTRSSKSGDDSQVCCGFVVV